MNTLTTEKIKRLSYPEFMGVLGLENTSLGGSFAVDYWIHNSKMNKKSKVLEIACSTGFNLRNCILKTKAFGIGIDVSKKSIEYAKKTVKNEKIKNNIQFKVEDAEGLSFSSKNFTHVISGMSFAFFTRANKVLKEVSRVLAPAGYLLTATPYYIKKPPFKLLDKIEKTLGFRPSDSWDYNWWKKFFSRFFLLQDELSIVSSNSKESITSLRKKIFSYIFNNNHQIRESEFVVKTACAERLYSNCPTLKYCI